MISLGGGMPNPSTFPFSHLRVGLSGDNAGTELTVDGDDLTAALQYSASTGLPPLTERLVNMARAEHQPPPAANDTLKVHVATGSQDILVKAFEMLLAPESSRPRCARRSSARGKTRPAARACCTRSPWARTRRVAR